MLHPHYQLPFQSTPLPILILIFILNMVLGVDVEGGSADLRMTRMSRRIRILRRLRDCRNGRGVRVVPAGGVARVGVLGWDAVGLLAGHSVSGFVTPWG